MLPAARLKRSVLLTASDQFQGSPRRWLPRPVRARSRPAPRPGRSPRASPYATGSVAPITAVRGTTKLISPRAIANRRAPDRRRPSRRSPATRPRPRESPAPSSPATRPARKAERHELPQSRDPQRRRPTRNSTTDEIRAPEDDRGNQRQQHRHAPTPHARSAWTATTGVSLGSQSRRTSNVRPRSRRRSLTLTRAMEATTSPRPPRRDRALSIRTF